MKRIAHIIISVAIALTPCFVLAQQYNIIRQGVCWTDTSGIDSSLTRMVYVSIAGAGPISVRYVNASGDEVDVSAGGSFAMGYCGCCATEDTLYYQSGEMILPGEVLPIDSAYTPGILPVTGNNGTRSSITELPLRLNYNYAYNRIELGTYPAEGASSITGILQFHDNGPSFQETAYLPGQMYINNWVTSSTRFLQGIELLATGGSGSVYARNNLVQSTSFSAVPDNVILNQIRFKNNYNTLSSGQITPFAFTHVSTTGTSLTGGQLYLTYASTSNYADITDPAKRYMRFDRNTRAVDLNNTYNGSTRNDSATDPPTRPLYTNANGEIRQAPLDSFLVYNSVSATNTTLLNAIASASENVANANLEADESYTTDWQNHSITFDFSGAPLDSMVYRFPSPDGKLQGLYVSDGEGNMSFIVNKIQSTDFDNMLDHNNAGIITLGNVNDSTIIQGDMIFIESPNMPQNDTLQNAYTKGAGNKVSITKIPYSGITTATTDGSGDITVTLGITMPDNTYAVTATPQGSTFQVCNVVSKTATSFVLRFYTAVGVPITSTEVTANWIVRDN